MKTTEPTYRVDPQEFLALGALAQAPQMAMVRKALMRHLRAFCRISRPALVLAALEIKGLIRIEDDKASVSLNEIGTYARRDPGDENIPFFVAVPAGLLERDWTE